ncbi:MAG: GPR endopeptidase [Firmicutes bacterium]|nr:GPR endopeptidase [Bacillota bacterium]
MRKFFRWLISLFKRSGNKEGLGGKRKKNRREAGAQYSFAKAQFYSDMAAEFCRDSAGRFISGIEQSSSQYDYGISKEIIKIKSDGAAKVLRRAKGNYVTVDSKAVTERIQKMQVYTAGVIADALKEMIANVLGAKFKKKSGAGQISVLVCGIGNRNMTADALGPRVSDSVIVTRHLLKQQAFASMQCGGVVRDGQSESAARGKQSESATCGGQSESAMCSGQSAVTNEICSIAPGVMGVNGIETGEIIKGIADKVKPDVIIAVDSLASRSLSRLATSFQITDTGLQPGGALGTKKQFLNKQTLGVPVIAIGVPLVVSAKTIVQDALEELKVDSVDSVSVVSGSAGGAGVVGQTQVDKTQTRQSQIADQTQTEKINLSETQINQITKKILTNTLGTLIVTPKDIDKIVDDCAFILSLALNLALNPSLDTRQVLSLMH